jgi:hypothetical protein
VVPQGFSAVLREARVGAPQPPPDALEQVARQR